MNRIVFCFLFVASLLLVTMVSRQGAAQSSDPTPADTTPPAVETAPASPTPAALQPEPNPPPATASTSTETAGDGPAARTGFQAGIRVGVAVPIGQSTGEGSDSLASSFGVQFAPLFLDIGVKVTPRVFIGGYLGGSSGVGAATAPACSSSGVKCDSKVGHLGAQVQYHLAPYDRFDPWFGYGLGLEFGSFSIAGGGHTGEGSLVGFEFGRFSAGLDYRSKHIGFGPVVDLAVSEYLSLNLKSDGVEKRSGGIDQPGLHAWLTLGVRFVLWP